MTFVKFICYHVVSISKVNQDLNLYRRHDDLKSMLDSSKDNLKLDAMKRIIGVSLSSSRDTEIEGLARPSTA